MNTNKKGVVRVIALIVTNISHIIPSGVEALKKHPEYQRKNADNLTAPTYFRHESCDNPSFCLPFQTL
jgi:hypothetical protein